MGLVDYMSEGATCVDMDCQRRDDAMRALLDRLTAEGDVPEARSDTVLEALVAREELGSTAIGKGVAVPHARVEGLDGVKVAFGYSEAGVEFNALDGEPVHEIFLVIGPKDDAEDYLSAMQAITRLVQNDDFRRFLAQSSTSSEVMELIEEMDH